jgi:hypothetical protein
MVIVQMAQRGVLMRGRGRQYNEKNKVVSRNLPSVPGKETAELSCEGEQQTSKFMCESGRH